MSTARVIAWGMGATSGAVGIGNLALTFTQHTPGRGLPTGMWVLLAVLVLVTVWLTTLTMVLGYLDGKPYRDLLFKAAQDPANSDAYTEVIDADSRHESVKNGAVLTDRQHGRLYRPDQ